MEAEGGEWCPLICIEVDKDRETLWEACGLAACQSTKHSCSYSIAAISLLDSLRRCHFHARRSSSLCYSYAISGDTLPNERIPFRQQLSRRIIVAGCRFRLQARSRRRISRYKTLAYPRRVMLSAFIQAFMCGFRDAQRRGSNANFDALEPLKLSLAASTEDHACRDPAISLGLQ